MKEINICYVSEMYKFTLLTPILFRMCKIYTIKYSCHFLKFDIYYNKYN